MTNFENNSLVIGQIKELLRSFNFPMIKVWKDSTVPYEGRVYLKEKKVVRYSNGEYKFLHDYFFNRKIVNITKKFDIKSSSYDNYTHECLGEYLRFLRDVYGVNLMGLYNCFNGERPTRITKKVGNFTVDVEDDKYNYYIVPVKFDEYYTIAIDSPCAYDIACMIYDSASIDQEDKELIEQSYKRVNSSKFSNPYLYSTFGFDFAKTEYSREGYMKLLIKLPASVESTITILEGDFSNKLDTVDGRTTDYIIDYNGAGKLDTLPSKLSLLYHNNHISVPFSDRLVEYILGQPITAYDGIYKNIGRIQEAVYDTHFKGNYGIWDDNLKASLFNMAMKEDYTKGGGYRYGNKIIKYNDHTEETVEHKDKKFCEIYDDLTYFVDKDIEKMIECKE